MTLATLVLSSLSLIACKGGSEEDTGTDDTAAVEVDEDGDGFLAEEDCDDSDAAVFPGASELCDGVDNNCDGEIDEEAPSWYADADADGFGAGAAIQQCESPQGFVDNNSDCDDTDHLVHPGAEEICDDVDQNCDGTDYEPATVSYLSGTRWVDVTADLSAGLIGESASGADLQFCEGTWDLAFAVDHRWTIEGVGDVVFDSPASHLLVREGGVLELRNVTLNGGLGSGSSTGAALSVVGGEAFFGDVEMSKATATGTAPVVFVQGGRFEMHGGSITDATTGGGAVKMWHDAEVVLYGVAIEKVTATEAGILNMWGSDASPLSILDTILDGNTSGANYGAISNYGGGVFTCTDASGFGAGVRNHNNAALSFEYDAPGTGAFWDGCDMDNVATDVYFLADGFTLDQWVAEDQSFECAYDLLGNGSELIGCGAL